MSHIRSVLLLFWVSALLAESLGTISGVVLKATTGVPLASSTVTLAHADGSPIHTVHSDRRGRYIFTGLPAGQYMVKAGRSNFAPGQYGQKSWNQVGAVIELASGTGFTAD